MNFLKNLFKKKPQINLETIKEEIAGKIKEVKHQNMLQNLRVKATLLKTIPLNTPEGIINLDIGTNILVDPERHLGQYGLYDFGMKREEYKVLYAN